MVEPRICPVCNKDTNYAYGMKAEEIVYWYNCPCGVIFRKSFDFEEKEVDLSHTKENQRHAVKTYAPVIDEITYGRQMLQVGYERAPEVMREFRKRGWIVWGIDENAKDPGHNRYKGDYHFYPFTPEIKDKEIAEELRGKERRFDLIWLQYFLERQVSPQKTLQRTYDLLEHSGVVYISTPEINYICKQGVQDFPHWQKTNNILFSERALVREVERVGFKVILARQNASLRFMGNFDIHLIAKK